MKTIYSNTSRPKNCQSGQTVIFVVIAVLVISLGLTMRGAKLVTGDSKLARETVDSKVAQIHSDTGVEDVGYRVRRAKQYDSIEVLATDGVKATTSISTNPTTNIKTLVASSTASQSLRKKTVTMVKGDLVNFNYAVQTGNGGFSMSNSSKVIGNIYSNGTVVGSGNVVQGSVVSAGASGLMNGIHDTSSVWAHAISNSTIDKDAYYTTLSNTTVGGLLYPNFPDRPPAPFPITDTQIEQWEDDAAMGGLISSPCPYTIISDITLGPVKVDCDIEIKNGAKVTLAGPIWVSGNITIKNSSGIGIDSTIGSKSVAFIADKRSDRQTSSKISIQNSTTFSDSGTKGSFIFLISANRSKEDGGSVPAIELTNSAQGPIILYSNHGEISIGNSSKLKSVTGYLISMKNSAELRYDDGLESSLFDTGPGGSWNVISWKESQ